MNEPHPPADLDRARARRLRRLPRYAMGAGLLAIAVALLVLVGWRFDIALFESALPGRPTMKANTAISLAVEGAALWLLAATPVSRARRRAASILAWAAALFGLLTLAEYAFGVDLGVDQLLFRDPAARNPGRPSAATAVDVVLLGAALLALDVEVGRVRPSEALAAVAALVAYLATAGHALGARTIYVPMDVAPHTALTLGALALAVPFARPDRGVMRVVTDDTPGGIMVRHLAPPLAVIPIALGALFAAGTRWGLFDGPYAFALFATASLVASVAVVTAAVVTVNRADASRRSAEALLHAVIEQMPAGVIVLDAKGTVALCNATALSLARGDSGAVDPLGNAVIFDMRRPSGEVLPWDEVPLAAAMTRGAAVTGAEIAVRARDDRLVPLLANAAPIRGASGEPAGAVVVFQDVTRLKELERLREEWTAVIAHDLRQPVSTVLTAGDLLSSMRKAHAPEAEVKAIERIRRGARDLERMIADLLDSSRIDAHRLELRREPTDLRALIEEVFEGVSWATEGHQVALDAPEALPEVDVDRGRIAQVLTNLLSNAAKYGDADAPIDVRVRAHDGAVEVAVTNRGAGVTPEQLARLFQRFYRTEGARSRAGLGLGLYITRGLVEAHGGRISAESTPGETTTFRFTIPVPA